MNHKHYHEIEDEKAILPLVGFEPTTLRCADVVRTVSITSVNRAALHCRVQILPPFTCTFLSAP